MSVFAVTPCAGVWIEIARGAPSGRSPTSLPVRECGLKYHVRGEDQEGSRSLPVRECGLKLKQEADAMREQLVTPCAGVWIEI